MKKTTGLLLAAVLVLAVLSGCGSSSADTRIDLQEFLEETGQRYDLGGIAPLDSELLDAFYPGLREVETTQLVAYMPLITGRVSEYVFVECADRDGAKAAEEILRNRAEEQAAGGAWYPESVAAWADAQVLTRGNYVLLIAAGELTDAIAGDFTALAGGA